MFYIAMADYHLNDDNSVFIMKGESDMKNIDWHAGFVPAMKLELMENEDDLVFEENHPVDNHGNEIDLLIIKNDRNVPVKSKLGAIFDRFNILEYKSPEVSVDMGAFYKTLAYTCLYLKETHVYDKYGSRAFTMTIVCTRKPIKLIRELARDNIIVTETDVRGIYILSGCIPFCAQFIVVKELSEEYAWLDLLTREANESRIQRLIYNTRNLSKPIHKEYADTVANIFVAANSEYIRQLQKEEPGMCKAVEELFAEEHRQEIAEMNAKLLEKDAQISKKDAQISQKDAQISKKDAQIKKLKEQLAKLQARSAML